MTFWIAAGLVFSSLVGLSLGLLGGGGSILAVPVLVHVAGFGPKEAIPMSLAVVGGTSIVASAMHGARKAVDTRAAALFGAASVAGAAIGAFAGVDIPGDILMLAFGFLMLGVSVWMYAGGTRRIAARAATRRAPAAMVSRILIAGAVVGALTGLLGVGGGFLVVPALVLFAGLPMPIAVGTSLVVIALNSAVAAVVHLQTVRIDPGWTIAFTAVSVAGAWVGFRLSKRLSAERLQRAFALLVFVVGIFVAGRAALLLV